MVIYRDFLRGPWRGSSHHENRWRASLHFPLLPIGPNRSRLLDHGAFRVGNRRSLDDGRTGRNHLDDPKRRDPNGGRELDRVRSTPPLCRWLVQFSAVPQCPFFRSTALYSGRLVFEL